MLMFSPAFGQEDNSTAVPDDNNTVRLRGIEVIEKRQIKDTSETITQEQIEIKGATNLWQLMGTLPGVVLTGGGERNESNFRLRGFDAARVPVYIDGVSQITPYRGEIDHGRILTYDIESVEVQKGYSSMLMGSNNLGGIISLTSAKPRKNFEASARYGIEFDSIFKKQQHMYLVSAGTRQDIFYAKLTVVHINKTHFRLPDSFTPVNDYQPDHERRDSGEKDTKLTLMLGVTPTEEFDAYVTYTQQRAKKASPGDVTVMYPKIWDYTRWDRDSVALNAAYTSPAFYTKLLVYYDKFDNRLYNSRPHGIPSDYDDYAYGSRLTAGYDFNKQNNLQMSAMWKTEKHNGHDNLTGVHTKDLKIEEYTYSFGAEYSYNPVKPLTVALGAGYDKLEPRDYWTATRGSESFNDADTLDEFVYQAGLFYDINENNEIHVTYSKKTHFPTMLERFSSRYDVTIPNPNLKPEFAYHYEVGYRGAIKQRASITAAVYYSDFRNKILQQLVRDPVTGQIITHSINKDKWLYYGAELGGEVYINKYFQAGLSLSYNKRDSKYDKDVQDAYYPELTASGYMVISPVADVEIIPRIEHTSSRYTSTDASNKHKVGDYTLVHLGAKIDNIYKYFWVEAGIENIFDRYYEIQEYFPMAGRTFSITVGGSY